MFSDRKSFEEVLNYMEQMSDYERLQWEDKIGFKSQKSMMDKLIREELIKDSLNRIKYAGKDISKVDERDYHSEYYYEMLNKGIIQLIDEGTPSEYWDCSVEDRSSTIFLNEDGLFAINDTLYQAVDNGIKSVFLPPNTHKNEMLKILDNDNQLRKAGYYSYSLGEFWSDWVQKGKWPAVQKRICIGRELKILEWMLSDNHHMKIRNNIYAKCQKTNLFNKWIYEFRNIKISGNWCLSVYKHFQSYRGSVKDRRFFASDLQGSIHPETGASGSPHNAFIITPNKYNQNPYKKGDNRYDYEYWKNMREDYPPRFDYINWELIDLDESLTATLNR